MQPKPEPERCNFCGQMTPLVWEGDHLKFIRHKDNRKGIKCLGSLKHPENSPLVTLEEQQHLHSEF